MTWPGIYATGTRSGRPANGHRVGKRVRDFIALLLPWFDPREEIRKDRAVAVRARKVDELTERIRAAYRADDERLARR